MLGTSDTRWTSHLSKRTSNPAYYIVDCRISGDVIIITKRTRVTLTTCNNSHDPYINYKAEPAQPLEKLSYSELRRCAKNTQSPSARSNQVTTYVEPESQTHLLHHSIVVVGSYWGVSLWNPVYKVSRTGNRNIEVWKEAIQMWHLWSELFCKSSFE